jgi:hypothetical protein
MPDFPMPATIEAVEDAGTFVQRAWIAAADQAPMPGGDRARYIAGLLRADALIHPADGDPFQARVVNRAPEAWRIEHGTPAYHLPERIRWAQSRAARRSRAGVWYLHVPLRWARPTLELFPGALRRGGSVMRPSVARMAERLRPGQRLTARATYGRLVHASGLRPYVPRSQRNVRPGTTHSALEEGMRRVPTRGGGAQYLTFRTMTEQSPGWWIPARPGTPLVAQVARDSASTVADIIAAGVVVDIVAHMQTLFGGP